MGSGLPSTYDRGDAHKRHLGFLIFERDGENVPLRFTDELWTRDPESDPTLVVPPSAFPVGIVYMDLDTKKFVVKTVQPEESRYR